MGEHCESDKGPTADAFPEVESVVEEQVRSILDEEDPLSPKRRILIVEKIVKALESSASWIGLYGATGHLNVPPVQTEEADIKQLLEKVLLVRGLASCFFLSNPYDFLAFEQTSALDVTARKMATD